MPYTLHNVELRRLGRVDYLQTWESMQRYTGQRNADTADEVWLLEHPPVYTLGLKCATPEAATRNGIPVVKVDRGGDITYHGPGQAIVYLMIDLQRRGRSIRWLVNQMEQVVIELLDAYGVRGERRNGAPGVYVDGAKLASLGLRVRRGRTYHGLALNVNMDLTPFHHIDPCGMVGMPVTELADLGIRLDVAQTARLIGQSLVLALDAQTPRHYAGHPTTAEVMKA